jgi:hypothetical protein
MSVDLLCVDPEHVFKIWPFVKQMVFAASDRTGQTDPYETEYQVLAGNHLLWIVWDGQIRAAATTHLSNNVCTFSSCGGNGMKTWLHFFPRLEAYARGEGSVLRICGRKGWQRALRQAGYLAETTIFEFPTSGQTS